MIVLGVGGPFGHDPAACLLVDGEVVAAVEEERLVRIKHARDLPCGEAIRYCLDHAGITPADVDLVAYPWDPAKYHAEKWRYARRVWRSHPSRALRAFTEAFARHPRKQLPASLAAAGFDLSKTKTEFVEHHIAHSAACTLFSGWNDCAVLSIDGSGEFVSTLIGEWRDGQLHKFREILEPDSLGNLYAGITEYLGFDPNDGEYKVMGMAAYGDPTKYDFSSILKKTPEGFRVEDGYVWVPRTAAYRDKHFSQKLVDLLGPPREGDAADDPYIHIAAALQREVERVAVHLIETHLADSLKRHGRLCIAGGVALNIKMNRVLLDHPLVKEVFVFPAAGDNGTPVGAAAWAAHKHGEKIKPLKHVYLGPEYGPEEIEAACRESEFAWKKSDDIIAEASDILAAGKVVAWFQGRTEFGPRSLGNRSIIGHPAFPGMTEEINTRIKFRERWRPFCPAILARFAPQILGSTHPAPYMVLSFRCAPEWKEAIREAVHVDGTIRPQVIDPVANPRFNALVEAFYAKTGAPGVINTSLNRRGEPMICRPREALEMFRNCALEYLVMGDFIVTRK